MSGSRETMFWWMWIDYRSARPAWLAREVATNDK
jgi:hypothetical protein